MKRFLLKTFAFILAIGFGQNMTAQSATPLSLCANPIIDGNEVELQVIVEGFDQILSYQFGVAWEFDKYTMEGVDNFADLPGIGGGAFSQITDDVPDQISLIKTLWFDPSGQPVSLDDGTVLFSIRLLASETPNPNEFGIAPNENFPIEFVNNALEVVDPEIMGTNCFVFAFPTTSNEDLMVQDFKLYPNPVADVLYIDGEVEEAGQLMVFNSLGQQIATKYVQAQDRIEIEVTDYQSGIYSIRYANKNNKILAFSKFVKK